MQKKVPYVAQLGNMDCSIACMTMLFRYYGLDVDIVDVGQVVHIGRDGVNLTQLKQATIYDRPSWYWIFTVKVT